MLGRRRGWITDCEGHDREIREGETCEMREEGERGPGFHILLAISFCKLDQARHGTSD